MTQWTLMIYLKHQDPSKEIQLFPSVTGSLEDAQNEAIKIVSKYGADTDIGSDLGGEFGSVWVDNHNYGDYEVYSRGCGTPPGYDFAIVYVGEPGWGT